MLELWLLIGREFISILEKFNQLFLSQLDITSTILNFLLTLHLLFNKLDLFFAFLTLFTFFSFLDVLLIGFLFTFLAFFSFFDLLLHLLLLCLNEHLLLFINLFIHLLLLLDSCMDLSLYRILLDSWINNVLAFSFFFWRDFIDNLFVGLHQQLLSIVLLVLWQSTISHLIILTATFQSREEVVQENTLSRLHSSLLALWTLFFCLTLILWGTATSRTNAYWSLIVDLGSPCSSSWLPMCALSCYGNNVLGSFGRSWASWLWWQLPSLRLLCRWVLLDQSLLMLNNLLQLFFTELIEEFFIEHWHFLLLLHELLELLYFILFWVRDGVETFFFNSFCTLSWALFMKRLLSLCWSNTSLTCWPGTLWSNELLVALLNRLTRFSSRWPLDTSNWTCLPYFCSLWSWCLH